MRWPSCLAAVLLVSLTTAAAQRGSRRFNPSNANDLPEEDATTRSHRFHSRDRSRSNDVVPRQDFPHRDVEAVPPTRAAPSRAPLRSRNEVPSRSSQKEVPIVSSGVAEYERLQNPVSTERSFTPRTHSSSSSNDEPRSRPRETSRPESRRSGTRFPKRDNTEGNTAPPNELVTRRSYSRGRTPSDSSQSTPENRPRNSLRKTPEIAPTEAEPRPRAPETTRPFKSPDSRTGGRHFHAERGQTVSEAPDARSRTRAGSRGTSEFSGRQSLRRGSSVDAAPGQEIHSRGKTSERFKSRTKLEEKVETTTTTPTTTTTTTTSAPYVEPTESDVRESPEPTLSANPLARGASRSRGRGTARASSADLKSVGLKEKESDGVSDSDNYPEVYKQLVKSGTDPKDILVPKYKQLISKYAKKPQNPVSGGATRAPRVTDRPDFKTTFTTQKNNFITLDYDFPEITTKPVDIFKPYQNPRKTTDSESKIKPQNVPKTNSIPSQFRPPKIEESPKQSGVGSTERVSNFRKPSNHQTRPKHERYSTNNVPESFQTKASSDYVGGLKRVRHDGRDMETGKRHLPVLTFDDVLPTEPWERPTNKPVVIPRKPPNQWVDAGVPPSVTTKYQTTVDEWDNRFVNGEYVSFKPKNDFTSYIPPLNPPQKQYNPPVLEPGFHFHNFEGRPKPKPTVQTGNFQSYWNPQAWHRNDPHDSHVSVTFNQGGGRWGVDYSLENSQFIKRRNMAERSAKEPVYNVPYQTPIGNTEPPVLPRQPPLVTRWGFQREGHTNFPKPQKVNLINQNPIPTVEYFPQTQFDVSKSNAIFETTYYGNSNGPVGCTYCTTVPPTAYSVTLNGRTFHKIETPHNVTKTPDSVTPPFISRHRPNPQIDFRHSTTAASTLSETRVTPGRRSTSRAATSPAKRINDIDKTTGKPSGDWSPYKGLDRPGRTERPSTKRYNPTIYAFNGKTPSATTPTIKAKTVPNETSNNIILNLVNIFKRFFGPPK